MMTTVGAYEICVLIFMFSAMAVGALVLGLGWFIPAAKPYRAPRVATPDIQIWAID